MADFDTPLDPDLSIVVDALASSEPVSGYTHKLYRYPARFSPEFVRSAIATFTEPGDVVLDPFVGGGTTLVEALATGRRSFGTDLNELAVFVSRSKTTLLGSSEVELLRKWAERLDRSTTGRWARSFPFDKTDVDHRVPWPIKKSLALAIETTASLQTARLRRVAKASLLRLGQWALDGRRHLPTRRAFLAKHSQVIEALVEGSRLLGDAAVASLGVSRRDAERYAGVRKCAAEDIGSVYPKEWGSPRLIVTSPPYHGIHIVYHRWQVQGRRETNAPYWLSGCNDGNPAAYYTFGRRHRSGPVRIFDEYFENVLISFAAIRALCDDRTLLVQLVGFSDPRKQLPRYREAMRMAGFAEVVPIETKARVSRSVPNRKWYLEALERRGPSDREFLLIHRKAE